MAPVRADAWPAAKSYVNKRVESCREDSCNRSPAMMIGVEDCEKEMGKMLHKKNVLQDPWGRPRNSLNNL